MLLRRLFSASSCTDSREWKFTFPWGHQNSVSFKIYVFLLISSLISVWEEENEKEVTFSLQKMLFLTGSRWNCFVVPTSRIPSSYHQPKSLLHFHPIPLSSPAIPTGFSYKEQWWNERDPITTLHLGWSGTWGYSRCLCLSVNPIMVKCLG